MTTSTNSINKQASSPSKLKSSLASVFSSQNIKDFVYPMLGIVVFLFIWSVAASRIDTSLGQFPGPSQVVTQSKALVQEYYDEQEKAVAFDERQAKRNAKKIEKNPDAVIKVRKYTGKETFFDQILTSGVYKAMNPLIQIFKPVSPLAWLPLITMVVSALYVSDDPMFEKSFLNSGLTVALCCLWPTLINTAVGVANVDKDLLNVSRVIRLPQLTHIRKIILPASVPMIFTGLRLSLATGWMVLIAAEMLSQNPGLGKFVWDEFQNGSSNSLSRIMVAVIVIGLIGFALDRIILIVQKFASWDKQAVLR